MELEGRINQHINLLLGPAGGPLFMLFYKKLLEITKNSRRSQRSVELY